jgi:hypothetical protein
MELERRLLVGCWQCTGRSINGAFSVWEVAWQGGVSEVS